VTTPFHHRIKTTLTSVQAIAQHTLRNNKKPVGLVAGFGGGIELEGLFPT